MQSVTIRCITLLLILLGLSKECYSGNATYKVRLSSSWYPTNRFELASTLLKHERNAVEKYESYFDGDKIKAMIVPHAGYAYSGDVAAAAYRLIIPHFFKRVIIIGPSHLDSFTGIALPHQQYEIYKNVLGHMDLDVNTLQDLSKHSLFKYRGFAHLSEHSINVQLPLIQKFCGTKCKLVPLLVGHVDVDQAEQIAVTLKPYIDDKTLVIISSDLTHHGPRFGYTPFSSNITQNIFNLDTRLVSKIENHDLSGFDKVLQKTGATFCGAGPIKILLGLVQQKVFGDVESHVVAYDTMASGQKNPEHSVSYMSLVVSSQKREDLPVHHRLTGYEKSLLLKLARLRLEHLLAGGSHLGVVVPGLLTNALRKPQGVFVTLHKLDKKGGKSLRGCVGTVLPRKPLYKAVHETATSAAFHDSRFEPVTDSDLPYLDISISALSSPESISSYKDIELGRDGIVLQDNAKTAVYLPKVPIEHGWSLKQTLSFLAKKAGLSEDDWKNNNIDIKTFRSIDFSENINPLEIMYEGYKG